MRPDRDAKGKTAGWVPAEWVSCWPCAEASSGLLRVAPAGVMWAQGGRLWGDSRWDAGCWGHEAPEDQLGKPRQAPRAMLGSSLGATVPECPGPSPDSSGVGVCSVF